MEGDADVDKVGAIVGTLADPLGAPRRLAIVEADSSGHGRLESDGGRLLSVDVVTDDGVSEVVLRCGDPKVAHHADGRPWGQRPCEDVELFDRQHPATDPDAERAKVFEITGQVTAAQTRSRRKTPSTLDILRSIDISQTLPNWINKRKRG